MIDTRPALTLKAAQELHEKVLESRKEQGITSELQLNDLTDILADNFLAHPDEIEAMGHRLTTGQVRADRIFYTCHPEGFDDKFIGIKEGETGYHATTVYDQAHAQELNRRQGITDYQVQSAIICSMFGSWHRFEEMTWAMSQKEGV